MAKNSELAMVSVDFSIEIVRYYKWLAAEHKEYVMSKQILRSGTSIGANIHEAYYAVSVPDFIAKMQIALKETSETEYWLTILKKTGYYSPEFSILESQCLSLKKMLISTLNTIKTKG